LQHHFHGGNDIKLKPKFSCEYDQMLQKAQAACAPSPRLQPGHAASNNHDLRTIIVFNFFLKQIIIK